MASDKEHEENPQEGESHGEPKTAGDKDEVQEQSEESFPASDPPSY